MSKYLCKKSKRGYINVEGVIIIPLFILAVLSIIYIMKYAIVMEEVSQITFDETKAYITDVYYSSIISNERRKLKDRIEEDVPCTYNVLVGSIKPFILSVNENHVLSYTVKYNVETPIPLLIQNEISARQRIVFRAFIGKDNSSNSLAEPCERHAYKEVWIFKKAGERYHKYDCVYIKTHAKKDATKSFIAAMDLDDAVKKGYTACLVCGGYGF